MEGATRKKHAVFSYITACFILSAKMSAILSLTPFNWPFLHRTEYSACTAEAAGGLSKRARSSSRKRTPAKKATELSHSVQCPVQHCESQWLQIVKSRHKISSFDVFSRVLPSKFTSISVSGE